MYHYDSELSNFVHCPAEFGRLAVFGWSEESRANARWRYCLEELWWTTLDHRLAFVLRSSSEPAAPSYDVLIRSAKVAFFDRAESSWAVFPVNLAYQLCSLGRMCQLICVGPIKRACSFRRQRQQFIDCCRLINVKMAKLLFIQVYLGSDFVLEI